MLTNGINFIPMYHIDGRVDCYEARIFDQEVALISPNDAEGWRIHGVGIPEELRRDGADVPLWNAFQRVNQHRSALTRVALARLASIEDLEGALVLKKAHCTL